MFMPTIFGERLFDDFFDDFARMPKRPVKYTVPDVMRTDVQESDEGYDLMIDLPGYKKEDVQAELKDGILTISASTSKENESRDEAGKYIRRERFAGSCCRSFQVGETVEQEDIKARFEDGILKIFVPKKAAKPAIEEKKYIAIEG